MLQILVLFLNQIFLTYNRINPDEGSIETFKDAHLTRQWLFKESALAKANNAGYSDLADRIAGSVHSDMLADMSQTHPSYYFPSRVYAETTAPLNDFARIMGDKLSSEDLTDRVLRAGELARRLSSNVSANPQEVFGNLDEIARKYGFTSNTDIATQNKFVQMIAKYYPTYAQTSLQGSVESAGEALGIGKNLMQGNILKAGGQILGKVLGSSEERQLQAIKDMVAAVASKAVPTGMTPEDAKAFLSAAMQRGVFSGASGPETGPVSPSTEDLRATGSPADKTDSQASESTVQESSSESKKKRKSH